MMSKYCSNITYQYDMNSGCINNLVPNLNNESKYVLHHRNLQLNLSFGIKLIGNYRISKFEQSD